MPATVLTTIVEFIRATGLPVRTAELPGDTFLPGVRASGNTLLYDPQRLAHPGDLLHEAGHIAMLSPAKRQQLDGDFGEDGGLEMAAIAWSYAAALHLDLPLDIVFHDQGYRGDADWLRTLFASGGNVGVPMLVWKGLCQNTGPGGFPVMRAWLSEG